MALLIISLALIFLFVIFIYKAIKKAPVKLNDEENQIDAVRYEERFSSMFENENHPDKVQDVRKDYSPQPAVKEKLILSPKR